MNESSFLNPQKFIAAGHVEEGMQVADLSGGGGFFARAAARAVGKSGVVWVVDANSELLARTKSLAAAEGLHNIEVVRGSLEHKTHLPAGKFDIAIAANIFFSLDNKEAAAAEIHRLLKMNGRALIADWVDSFGGLGPTPSHVVSRDDIARVCEAHGLAFVEDLPAGAYHWGFVVRKKRNQSALL